MPTGASASGLATALQEVKSELGQPPKAAARNASLGVSPLRDPDAVGDCERRSQHSALTIPPKLAPNYAACCPAASAGGVSILGLQKKYRELNSVFETLASRDRSMADLLGDGPEDTAHQDGPVTKINFVDFAKPLTPLPEDMALKTDSDANKFAMLVWRMLDACESGSTGGDAMRQAEVMAAAANDAFSINMPKQLFEHCLGLTFAIMNHGVESYIQRGDPDVGEQVFRLLATKWRTLFVMTDEMLGIPAELRKLAINACDGLQKYLKSESNAGRGFFQSGHVFKFVNWGKPAKKRPASVPNGLTAKRQKGASAAATAAPVAVSAGGSDDTQVKQMKKTISSALCRAVKATTHGERSKPYTTIEVPVPQPQLVPAVFGSPAPKKLHFDSARGLLEWLPDLPSTVHPVKHNLNTWSLPGQSVSVYVWAGFLSADVTWIKGKSAIKLKVRTQMIGSGKPQASRGGEKMFDGYVECSSAAALKQWVEDKEMEM